MATEEHFPPPSSARVKETDRPTRRLLLRLPDIFRFLLMARAESGRSSFTAQCNWDEEAGRGEGVLRRARGGRCGGHRVLFFEWAVKKK